MILKYLLEGLGMIADAFFNLLPEAHIENIPVIGASIVDTLTDIVKVWNAFIETFPYAEIAWHVFLFWIIPLEVFLLVGKFFFGQRLPAKDMN